MRDRNGAVRKIGNNDLFADNNEVRFRKLYRDLRFAGGICLPLLGRYRSP